MSNYEKLFSEISKNGTDFAASTYAFLEQKGKDVSSIDIKKIIDEDQLTFFMERLIHYRHIYKRNNKTTNNKN
ncbi:glycogen synthase [Enterobacter mori]